MPHFVPSCPQSRSKVVLLNPPDRKGLTMDLDKLSTLVLVRVRARLFVVSICVIAGFQCHAIQIKIKIKIKTVQ